MHLTHFTPKSLGGEQKFEIFWMYTEFYLKWELCVNTEMRSQQHHEIQHMNISWPVPDTQ